ncbi:hypothetical protein LPJ63_004502 [Coemansia sp. RSA 2711]|nr:hypothetical protein LPJ63_004502 [Coemansia sp. RSA 2711]
MNNNTTAFTIFWTKSLAGEVGIYPGIIHDRPKETEPLYTTRPGVRKYQLWDAAHSKDQPLLLGKLDHMFGSSITVRGDYLVSRIKGVKSSSVNQTFVYNAEQFTWVVGRWNKSMSLQNGSGVEIVSFDRSMSRMSKIGELRLNTWVGKDLLQVLLLSWSVTYQTMVALEQSGVIAS